MALCMTSEKVWALPSFAQQTGVACAQCHTIAFGPQLTTYGRQFKLNGYVWGNSKGSLPFALMAVAGYSHTAKDLPEDPAPHYSTNSNFAMNELTGFYAGRITKHVGAFIEAAYSGVERHTAWGAFDVRYARSTSIGGKAAVFGVSINNNPTVTDPWNSTPVWSFPYTGSDLVPTPGTAPILFDGISERVLGPTFYMLIADRLYVEAGAYHGMSDRWLSNVGLSADDNLNLDGLATYWRAALQFDHGHNYYSVGLLGLNAKQRPELTVTQTDAYRDLGLDATYQYSNGGDIAVTANLSLVREQRSLDGSFAAGASDSTSNHLNSVHFDSSIAFAQTWVASLGWFDTRGSRKLKPVSRGRGFRQCQRLARHSRLYAAARVCTVRETQFLRPTLAQYPTWLAIHGLSALQRGPLELRLIRTIGERQQHNIRVCLGRVLTKR